MPAVSIQAAWAIARECVQAIAASAASSTNSTLITSGLGSSAEFASAGNVAMSANTGMRARAGRPIRVASIWHASATSTSIQIVMPTITLVSPSALTGNRNISYNLG